MESKYLNVKEFAALVGVSASYVYKRVSNPNDPIVQFVSMTNNHLSINTDAVDLFKKRSQDKQEKAQDDKYELAAERHRTNNILSRMMDVVDVLKDQLDEKDKQIEDLQHNLSKCINIIGQKGNKKEHEF